MVERMIAANGVEICSEPFGAPDDPAVLLVGGTSITAPTLVIHGSADPMFPREHGEAVAAEISGARLVTLEGAGHGVDRVDWERIVDAIVEHTDLASRARGA